MLRQKITVFSMLVLAASAAHAKGPAAPAVANLSGEAEGKHPAVALDTKGGIHAVYEAIETGGKTPDIWYVQSADGGKTWSKPVDVSSSPGTSMDPAIDVGKDGSVVAVWTDTSGSEASPDIYFSRSTDGKTWSKPQNLSNSPGVSSEPDVDIGSDGAIHVIYLDTSAGSNADVWATSSSDDGKTWSKPQNISDTPGKSMTPSIGVGPDKSANVVWIDTSSGEASPDVYFTRSTDGGKTWSKAVDASNTPGLSADADIDVDDKGKIFITWADTAQGAKNADIMVSSSADGGKTWSKPVNVSNTPGNSSDPAIAATGNGKVAVIWVDTSESAKEPDVYVATSGNGGKTFTKARNLSNTPGASKEPDIAVAVGGKVAFAVWEDEDAGKTHVHGIAVPLP
jgi:hypothetical protein